MPDRSPALDDVLAKAGLAGYLLSRVGCPPVTGLDRIDPSNLQCAHFADAALETIVSIKPAVILLAARWAFYFEGTRYGAEEGPNALFSPEGNVAIVASRLDATLAILGQLAPQLVLVESVPEIGVDVSSTLARAAILGRHIDIAPLRFAYEARQDKSAGAINSLAKKHGAVVIRPEHYLCDEVRCAVERGGRVLYRDYDHLSQAGAALLIPMFAEILSPSSGE